MLPSSRLLPATIAATSVVLGLKVLALVVHAPAAGTVWTKTRQAVLTASVIPDARAAGPDAPAASPPQPVAGNAEPPPAADPAKPLLPPPATMQQAAHFDAPGVDAPRVDAPHVDMPRVDVSRVDAPGVSAEAVASDITLHRSQIEERERRLSQREAAVAAAEKQLADRVAQLLAIQSHLQALVNDYKDHDDAKWAGLVKLYEGMRPRDAAVIFNGLDKPVLLEILGRMKPAKAAPVIALMLPENAREVTADLAAQHGASTTAVTN
jgi:flagellar motility protein MotE (MotC chaperone)